tara:strand:- start:81 stop:986 length:906 start_codon:yes stop_codon:yes gene_type:complete
MKIALCLSGQPRNLDECYPYIQKALLENNDVDVFAHIWWDDDYEGKTYMWHSSAKFPNEDLSKKFLAMYKPVAYKIEKQKQFDLSFCEQHNYNWIDKSNPQKHLDIFTPGALFCVTSQSYSILQADLLRQQYNETYDVVIRARTDLLFRATPKVGGDRFIEHLHHIPDYVLWQSSMGGGPAYCGEHPNNPCDWFCAASPESMTKLTHAWYHSIPAHYSKGVIHITEYVKKFTSDAGLEYGLVDFFCHVIRNEDGTPLELRQPQKYWDDFDSNTGEIKSRKEEWPYWAEDIDFKRLAKGDNE